VGLKIKIYYPFHPLHGSELELHGSSSKKSDTYLVNASDNFCKQIPKWMTEEEASSYSTSPFPLIGISAIQKLIELIELTFEKSYPFSLLTKPSSS